MAIALNPVVHLLWIIVGLLAAQVVIGILILRGKRVSILGGGPAVHQALKMCAACGLLVARYDDRGICPNCLSEGK